MAASTTTRRELLSGRHAPHLPATDRLIRLLEIELLAVFTYDHVLASPVLTPGARRVLAPIRAHEGDHADALRAALRERGAQDRSPHGPADIAAANRDLAHRQIRGRLGQLRGAKDALNTLLALERVVVGAYFVALLDLTDRALIALVVEIMASDAQHEVIVGELLNPGEIPSAVPYGLVQGVQ